MKKKILLIEDNPDVRENTAEILEMANYSVTTAENGKVGVDKAKTDKPDLIICDIMMPELDGYGVLYMLGKDATTSAIPFIFLTAKTEKVDFRKGMSMGADDYITKPFEEMELLNAVETRLQKSERFRKAFAGDAEGLYEFLDDVRNLEELEKLSTEKKHRTFKKKDVIYHEGDFPNALFFIKSGKVKTYKMNSDGKEYVTGLHKEGDFVGYMALLEEDTYQDSAMALDDLELVIIPKQDFLSLLYNNRDVAQKFIRMLSSSIIEKENQLLSLAYNTVRKRVAEALVYLQKKYKEDGGDSFRMAISRDDLASIVGTATESVIRTLSDFKEESLIEVSGREITILQPEKLANLKF
ncbi:MAG: response regulator [Flavobacteriales bacterium]|nr:response regulator [Flavobacteriales bacterium]